MARCGSGYLNRRIADRGNDGGALDLFDHEVEQSQRLAWLTPGLGAVEWVERLQHLVPGLGLVSSSSGKETEPVKTVRDELTGNEEHPPNGDIICDYPPAYDEYEDEEWYYWMTGAGVTYDSTGYVTDSLLSLKSRRILAVDSSPPCFDCYKDYGCVTRALNVVVVQEGGTVQEEIIGSRLECVKVSAGILNDFVMSDKTEIGGVNGLVPLVANGDRMAKSTANEVVFPYIEPRIMDELNVCSVKEEIKEVVSQFFNSKIQHIIVNEAGHNGDKYTPKAIIGFIAGNCMDEKVACGCGMHGLFQLTCGGSIDKHRKPVEPNKEVCMKTELDDATTKFDGQIRGIDYVFDPGGWFLKLSKLEDEFFSKRRRMMRIDMDQFELEPC